MLNAKIFMNCSKNFIDICKKKKKKKKRLPPKEYIRCGRFERINRAEKCKIFEAISLMLDGHYTQMYGFQNHWHKYREQNISAKQGTHKFIVDTEEIWLPNV